MNDIAKLLIEKLPVKFVATVLLVVLGWFGVLTGTALFTNRSVSFFPPHIGTDKALLAELQQLSSQVAHLTQIEQIHRTKMLELVVKAREESLSISRAATVFGSREAQENVSKSEEALRNEDEKFLMQIEELQKRVQQLSAQL